MGSEVEKEMLPVSPFTACSLFFVSSKVLKCGICPCPLASNPLCSLEIAVATVINHHLIARSNGDFSTLILHDLPVYLTL